MYRLDLSMYPFKQWLSTMYNDFNGYLNYDACEYCDKSFNLFEKLIIPKQCVRGLIKPKK